MTLERDLRGLAEGVPDAPDLVAGVLAAGQRARARRRSRRRVATLALALLLLVPATALAVSGDLRERVLRTFGLRDVSVIEVTRLPELGPDARRLQLGSEVSLARARRDLAAPVSAPRVLGAPDGIYELPTDAGPELTFLYEPPTVAARTGVRRRVLVSIVRGTISKTVIGKTIPRATKATPLDLGGGAALLLTGAPHMMVVFARSDGGIAQTYTRLAGTTLLWQRRGLLIRIEGELSRARLIAVARSLSTG
jgi:hypothetical protein